MTREQAKTEIIALWHLRPPEKKSGVDGLDYFQWLEQERPDLLEFEYNHDKYQLIASWIKEHLSRP